jgi:opacity protein-like surface antigen
MLAIGFGGVPSELASLESRKSPSAVINGMRTEPVAEMSGARTVVPIRPAKARLAQKSVVGIALAGTFAAIALLPTAASAQVQPGCTSTFAPSSPDAALAQITGGVVGAANTITSVIGTMNTSFIAQGNAFVAGLPNATPDELSGGTWGRLIGGRVDDKATGTFNGTSFLSGLSGATGTINCNTNIRQDFGGVQIGQDLARLNLSGSGATLHLGVTGGYAQSAAQDQGGSNSSGSFQVPFAGVYAAYTNGNFFADALLRGDFYQMTLNGADAALSNQQLNAFGLTESASAGYQIDIGNKWFFEPSVSGIHSATKIDTLNMPGGWGNNFNAFLLPPATVQFNTVESWLGRVGARVGTTFTGGNVVWQPFATASVWHEFAGPTVASYNANVLGVIPFASGSLTGSRVGTYGQYSLGIFGQVTGTPWLGYLRLDYKEGANIEGVGFNAGLRYQFDPSQAPVVASGIYKTPPRAAAYDWTGFYAGAFTGAAFGKSHWFFPTTDPNGVGSGLGYGPAVAGGLLGGTLGYNKQYDRWVLGVEGDIALSNASGGQSCQPNLFDFTIGQNCNNTNQILATADARIGYTPWDRVLVYAKGGAAWTNDKLNIPCNGDALLATNFSCYSNSGAEFPQNLTLSDPRLGGTIGAGFEIALTPAWSAKAEYDFLDFGSRTVSFSDGTPVTIKESFSEVKVGVNYHLNAADAPATSVAPIVATKMPVKAPVATPYNWTGAYAGVEVGDRMASATWTTTALPGAIIDPFSTIPDPTTNPASFFSAALQGGVFAGYDWQIAPKWVTGIEGDIAFGNSSMTRGGIPGTYGNGNAALNTDLPGIEAELQDSSSVKFGWDSSVRARVGYLSAPDILIYGTGGIAFQQVSVGASCNPTAFNPTNGGPNSFCGFPLFTNTGTAVLEPAKSERFSTVRAGWTLGAGLEGVLTGNWIGKLDFRYANFGNVNHNFFAGTLDEVDTSTHLQTYTFAAGLGYKFNGTGSLTK